MESIVLAFPISKIYFPPQFATLSFYYVYRTKMDVEIWRCENFVRRLNKDKDKDKDKDKILTL